MEPSYIPSGLLPRMTAIQYYASGWSSNAEGPDLIMACRVGESPDFDEIETRLNRLRPNALHFDTYHVDKLGGSGEVFNWDIAVEAKRRFGLPLILAGGLTPDNIADAIAKVKPYAVDVSSGVEEKPGIKDHSKLREFIRAVRRVDSLMGLS